MIQVWWATTAACYDVGVGLQNNQLPCTEIGEAFGPFRVNTGELYWPWCGRAFGWSGIKSEVGKDPLQKQTGLRNRKGKQMIESSSNLQNKKPSRVTVVNWGGLLSVIADELEDSITVLRSRECAILKVQQDWFRLNEPSGLVLFEALEAFTEEIDNLEGTIGYVKNRFDRFKTKSLKDLANDALRDGSGIC